MVLIPNFEEWIELAIAKFTWPLVPTVICKSLASRRFHWLLNSHSSNLQAAATIVEAIPQGILVEII
jgi:hypothetical protein